MLIYRIAKWYPKVGKTIPAQAAYIVEVDQEALDNSVLPLLAAQHHERPPGQRPLVLIEPLR